MSSVKSSVFFSKGVADSEQQAMAQELGMALSTWKAKYLGLPYLIGISKQDIFAYAHHRVAKKTNGWNENLSSQAGEGNSY